MTWPTPQLIAWIERIERRGIKQNLFELLEVGGAGVDTATIEAAFLRVAGGAHPDLHRHTLPAADAERLVRAYGKVAAAYDTLRDPKSRDRYRKELTERGRPTTQPPVVGGSQSIPQQRPGTPSMGVRARTSSSSAIVRPPPTSPPMTQSRTTTSPAVARTMTPSSSPPRTKSPSPAPGASSPSSSPPRTKPPSPAPRASSPSPPSRTSSPTPAPAVAAGSSSGFSRVAAPAVARTSTTSRAGGSRPPADRAPIITPAPDAPPRSSSGSQPPTPSTTASNPAIRPPTVSRTQSRSFDSRPPSAGVGPRAQIYFRKAQSCLARGDLGGALFNLRLAAAADPTSALIRVALAEVEVEVSGGKKP